jgi:aromatic-L-amino-acid decarboxylase
MTEPEDPVRRRPATPLTGTEFRAAGHALIDRLADFFDSIEQRPVTRAATPQGLRTLIDGAAPLPEIGRDLGPLLAATAEQLIEHSLHNGHPRFFGYVTSTANPVGALADLLAAAVNPNVGLWDLAPLATEIENQCIRWLAELIGYDPACGGLMVSGGNVANLIGFWAARRARAPWDVRTKGLCGDPRRLRVYASRETHTWIQKAADLSGLGTDALRWIATDGEQRVNLSALAREVAQDRSEGREPFLVVASAGTVSTGAIDPLPELADFCAAAQLWLHVDGAYGAPAAALPEAPAALRALARADSVALDPHKWLYSPLEAGCLLIREPRHLPDTFGFRPAYYRLEADAADPRINYYERGIQNSRGFRALKVWLSLRHLGRAGHVARIREDIALARRLFAAAQVHPELEACTQGLSITTFRFVPKGLTPGTPPIEAYLNILNEALLSCLQRGGEAFVSNAIVGDRYLLRACIVNFRTCAADVDALVEIAARAGRTLDATLRPAALLH